MAADPGRYGGLRGGGYSSHHRQQQYSNHMSRAAHGLRTAQGRSGALLSDIGFCLQRTWINTKLKMDAGCMQPLSAAAIGIVVAVFLFWVLQGGKLWL